MITAIGSTGLRPALDALRGGAARSVAASGSATAKVTAGIASPVADLVAEGAPVDMDKVSAIKAALAAGTYRIDPQAIADRMIAADLPAA